MTDDEKELIRIKHKINANWIGTYFLDENKKTVPCTKMEWAEQREEMRKIGTKHIAKEDVNDKWVSTVWLGLDYSHDGKIPLLFETLIKDNVTDTWLDYEERYSTWEQAVAGHKRAVQWVLDGCIEDE